MNIRVTDDYELRPTSNGLDWQVHERRTLRKSNNPKVRSREGETEWVALESYHRDVESALKWIMKHMPRNQYKAVEADLAGAIDELRRISKEIERNAKRFEKAMA